MVRLVFRPYTQVRRSICTSESLRASTRVSSGFTLLRHSSPSFGSQQMRSYSNLSKSRIGRSMMRFERAERRSHLGCQAAFTFIVPLGFDHPKTCAHVRLLGPCFKTGRMKPYGRQQPKCMCARSSRVTKSISDALHAVRHGRHPVKKRAPAPPKRSMHRSPLPRPNLYHHRL
jgi:hypothetical protein